MVNTRQPRYLAERHCSAITFAIGELLSRQTYRGRQPPSFRRSFTIMAHTRVYVLSTWRLPMSVKSPLGLGLSAIGLVVALAEPASAAEKSRIAVLQTGTLRDTLNAAPENGRFQASTERAQLAVT